MEREIIEIIASMSLLDESEIAENDFLADIGIDSLKRVEMILNLEDKFKITFDDSELDPDKLATVKRVIDLVKKYLCK